MLFFIKRNRENKHNPLVVLPGLFGSLGNDIIPGTGELDFGLAEFAYRPLIKNLEAMGYKEGSNLYIAYYDWTKKNLNSAEKYLIPVINKAKENTGSRKVDVLCHSMGGIVARSYIQSSLYQYDIDKLIMLATPNSGSANAYYFWGGGHLPNDELRGNIFYKILRRTFLLIFKIIYKENNDIELLHRMFPSIQELLPTLSYGDYIFYENSRSIRFIPIMQMKAQNYFLNKINKEQNIIYNYGIRTYLISGIGVETNQYICIDNDNKYSSLWTDGKPKYAVKTFWGDGTVTYTSSNSLYGLRSRIYTDHIGILRDSGYILSRILGKRISYREVLSESMRTRYLYSIITRNIDKINVNINGTVHTIDKNMSEKNSEITVKRLGNDIYTIIIALSLPKKIWIEFEPMRGKYGVVSILKGTDNRYVERQRNIMVKETYKMEL